MQNNSATTDQGSTTYHNSTEEIPQLEEDDWENGQYADADTNLIDQHNTHTENKHIQKKYFEQLLNLTDNQYYSE